LRRQLMLGKQVEASGKKGRIQWNNRGTGVFYAIHTEAIQQGHTGPSQSHTSSCTTPWVVRQWNMVMIPTWLETKNNSAD
jgi:hypothetical protein